MPAMIAGQSASRTMKIRELGQPTVIGKAALAAAVSTLACLPNLVLWEQRNLPVWYLAAVLFATGFVLWAFVFAWYGQLTGRQPLAPSGDLLHWVFATAWAVFSAIISRLFWDPDLRAAAPSEYPQALTAWGAHALFSLAFTQLFLVFAPVAFFGRLIRKRWAVLVLTVAFNGFVFVLKTAQTYIPMELFWPLLMLRLIAAAVAVWFYLQGGVWTLLWISLLVQMRHLPGLLGNLSQP